MRSSKSARRDLFFIFILRGIVSLAFCLNVTVDKE